jgi:anthranilate synthase component 2
MILVIDNYDSFTWNLVQYLGELGADPLVRRNDEVTPDEIPALAPEAILLSPGPKSPAETEPTNAILRAYAGKLPILGVCLGHQCLAHVFGGRVVRAARLMHGKVSPVHHDGCGLFLGLPDPFPATRYHSLLVERESLPAVLEVTAWTDEGEIMAMRHRDIPAWGVQFHPESILTEGGMQILANFLDLARAWNVGRAGHVGHAGHAGDAGGAA